jgi:hypothetical protein
MSEALPPGLPVQAYANPLDADLGTPDPLDALPSGMRDYLDLQPVPPLTPDLLGLGAPPAPPAPPRVLGPKGSNLGELVALAMAAFMGPGKGTGLLQGVQASRMQAEQARQQLAEQHQQIYTQRQRMYQWEQQQYAADAHRRQQTLEQNVKALQGAIPTLKTKADYDRTLDTFTAGLQAMGLRVDGNYLRSRVPYVAPSGVSVAQTAIERWRKNPQNEQLLKEHPEQAALAKIPLDRDGDGVPEMVLLDEAMTLAGMGFAKDEGGAIVWDAPGTSQSDKANADGIYADLIAQDRAEGKVETPERRIALRQEAMKRAKQAQDLGPDPTLQAIRELQAQQLRRDMQGTALTPRQMSAATSLSDDFARESKDFLVRAQSFNTILSSAKDPSAAGDLALIFAYMKMLDPGSTVREGEFANAQNAAGVPDQIKNFYNRVMSGERLNTRQRADFTSRARGIYSGAKRMQAATTRTYTDRARIAGVPVEMVVRDFSAGVEIEADGAAETDPAASARQKLGGR